MRMEQSPRGIWPWLVLGGTAGSEGTLWALGSAGCTFSALLREVSGFTRMDGGADAGGFGAASLFTGGSLTSRITELHTEGVRLSPPLTSSAGEASWEKFGLVASSMPAPGGMLCGGELTCG